MTEPADLPVKVCTNPKHGEPNPVPVTDFYRSAAKRDGLTSWCKRCFKNARMPRDRQRKAAARAAVFARYGQRCACCGATEQLTIDHPDGDGAEHRTLLFGDPQHAGSDFYLWLAKQGFPDGYVVLCASCNSSKRLGSVCILHDPEAPPGSKRCTGPCGQVKPLTAFHRQVALRDGRTTQCKECRNARQAAYRRNASGRGASPPAT